MKNRLLLLALMLVTSLARSADFKRTEDVIYARKFGTALTLDVFQPSKPNGAGVIFMVSGGFFSSHEAISANSYKPLLDHGYTVFAVVHGSQPRFIIPEIMQDVHRATRFIRHNASKYGVDPNKLGVTGGSAGGHLSLILGTQGAPGKADAKDPVDRESSGVQAVACFFPPTDFANWGSPGDDGVGFGTTIQFKPAFGPRSDTAEGRQALSKEISPIHFVHSNMPPILITHGDSDKLVPIYQAQIFEKRVKETGSKIELIVKPGKDHGWPGMDKDMEVFAQWFDEHLLGQPPEVIAQFWQTFFVIVKEPFLHADLVWGIVPLYFGWLLNELTSSKASFRTALQTGFAFVWAAAQWLWQYARKRPPTAPIITVDALLAVNMIVTLLVLAVGLVALLSGIFKKFPKHGKFLGHTRFAAYFMITMFPMQAHYLSWTWERLVVILIFAVPTWLVVHVGLIPVRK